MTTGGFTRFSISHFLVLMALAIALVFPNLGRGGLSGYDDALYAHEGKEMLRSGDFSTVRFNGQPNFEYPPLFIWMEAASMKAFGANDYAAKLPSALAGLATIVVLYFLVAELTSDFWLASVAMFCLTTTQLFVKYATHAMTDVPFTLFVTLALYFYVRSLRTRWYLILAGGAVAMAIMTRSVIGLFPLAVMAVHLLLTHRRRLWSMEFLSACVLAVGLPLIWFGFPPRPEHVAFVLGKVNGGGAPIHVLDYVWILLRFYWPWLPFAVVGAVLQWRERRLLPLVWLMALLVPLSVASTKYARYLEPAMPALGMVAAVGIDRLVPHARRNQVFGVACCVVLLVALFSTLVPAKERGMDMRLLAPVADASTRPTERVLIYTAGNTGYDIQNQFLWYGSRYSRLITNMKGLTSARDTTLVIDKESFASLAGEMPGRIHTLGESEKFLCVRIQ